MSRRRIWFSFYTKIIFSSFLQFSQLDQKYFFDCRRCAWKYWDSYTRCRGSVFKSFSANSLATILAFLKYDGLMKFCKSDNVLKIVKLMKNQVIILLITTSINVMGYTNVVILHIVVRYLESNINLKKKCRQWCFCVYVFS